MNIVSKKGHGTALKKLLRVLVLGCFFHFSSLNNGFSFTLCDFQVPDAGRSFSLAAAVFQGCFNYMEFDPLKAVFGGVLLRVSKISAGIESGFKGWNVSGRILFKPRRGSSGSAHGHRDRASSVGIGQRCFYIELKEEIWTRTGMDNMFPGFGHADALAMAFGPETGKPNSYGRVGKDWLDSDWIRKTLKSVIRPIPEDVFSLCLDRFLECSS